MVTTTTGLATSFINFTRASNATVTNNVGNIAWAGHNLLTNSESFDASSWIKGNTSISANTTVTTDPIGRNTAEKVAVLTTTSSEKSVYNITLSLLAVRYTWSVYAKAAEMTWITVNAYDGVSNHAWFDLANGVVGTVSAGNTATITPVGNGWYLCSVTRTASATAGGGIGVNLAPSDNVVTFTGTAGNGAYIWGASLFRSDLGGMVYNPAQPAGFGTYYPTTPPNRIGFTESFDSRDTIIPNAWTYTNITVLANNTVAPNSLPTADLVTATSTNSAISQVFATVAGCTYTLSVYAKAGNIAVFDLGGTNQGIENYWARFDLANGTAVNISGGTIPSITSVGNGWYRCSLRKTVTAGNVNDLYAVFIGQRSATVSGNSIYLWGAQVSDSASIDPYSPVYGAAVTSAAYYAPRLDYDPVNLQPRGILIEEQRTNVVTSSNDYTVVAWNKSGQGTGLAPVVTANNAVAPDGTTTAQRVVFDRGAGNTSADRSILSSSISGYTASREYTGSVYIKAATAGDVGKQVGWRHVAGGAYGVITLTASWQRVTRTETSFSTSSTIDFESRGTITADNTVGAHIWGVAVEIGPSAAATTFATSLIPTNGAQVTRNIDIASVTTQAFPYSATEGAIVVSADFLSTTYKGVGDYYFAISNAGITNDILIADVSGAVGQVKFNGSLEYQQTIGARPAANTPTKVGIAFAANNVNQATNGTLGTTDTSVTMPLPATLLTLGLRGDLSGGSVLNGHIRQVTYLPRRISNSELQQRTV